jgi:hypothetical protein
MSSADAPIASFDFTGGSLRGTHLILLPGSLLHRGGAFHETIPLRAVAAIRVAFARNERQLAWGGALVVIGLILIASSGPLAALAGAAADEVAAQARSGHGAASLVIAVFHSLQTYARLLPVVSVALALWAAALFALGWLGVTTLTLTLGGGERAFPVRGRSVALYEFAEAASERILESRR